MVKSRKSKLQQKLQRPQLRPAEAATEQKRQNASVVLLVMTYGKHIDSKHGNLTPEVLNNVKGSKEFLV